MKQGDRIQVQGKSGEFEVVEDTGKNLTVIHTTTQEPAVVNYYKVITDMPRCAYCGRPRDASELKSGEIIYRTRERGRPTIGKKTGQYCGDKPCHGYDQMAHEG